MLRRSLKTYFVYAPLTADLCATKVAARGSTGAVFVPGARTVALPEVQARVHHATWQHGPVRSVRSDIFHGYISPVRMQVRLNAEPSGQSTEPLTTLTTGFPTAPQEVRIVCEQTFHRSAGACRFAAHATARAETRRQRFRSASVLLQRGPHERACPPGVSCDHRCASVESGYYARLALGLPRSCTCLSCRSGWAGLSSPGPSSSGTC